MLWTTGWRRIIPVVVAGAGGSRLDAALSSTFSNDALLMSIIATRHLDTYVTSLHQPLRVTLLDLSTAEAVQDARRCRKGQHSHPPSGPQNLAPIAVPQNSSDAQPIAMISIQPTASLLTACDASGSILQ